MTLGHEHPRPVLTASWRTATACRHTDVDVFFPDTGERHKAAKAKAICDGCPVRVDCLEDALATFDAAHDFGIRGGLTVRARNAERLRRARNAA